MVRGLGSQMEPTAATNQNQHNQSPVASEQAQQQPQKMVVNSDLVSLSIVAELRKSVKVDLSAPIELVFRHLAVGAGRQQAPAPAGRTPTADQSAQWAAAPAGARPAAAAPRCVYWDTSVR